MLVEFGAKNDFERLAAELEDTIGFRRTEHGFWLRKICFFRGSYQDVILYSSKKHFDFMIFDIGTAYVKKEVPFLYCDQKIVLGSHLEWRVCEYEKFISYAERFGGVQKWEYVDVTGGKARKAEFIYDRKVKLKKLPRMEESFIVTEELSRIYWSFL